MLRTAILLVWKDIMLAFHWKAYLECSFWVMCNLLSVFIVQLRSHIWWGWYQLGILGSHASIMASVKLGNYIASVINLCDQYNPPLHRPCSYLWMAEFDKGAVQVGSCLSHDTSTKEPSKECWQDSPPPRPFLKKNLMPHITTNTLSIPSLLRPSYVQRCWGGERVPQWRVVAGGYTDSGCVWSEGRQPLAGVERSLAGEAGSYLITWRGSGPFSHN